MKGEKWGYDSYSKEWVGKGTPCEYELLKFNSESKEWECQGIYADDEETMVSLVKLLNDNNKI